MPSLLVGVSFAKGLAYSNSLPTKEMTTDNALMIAFAASMKRVEATSDYSSIEANPRFKIY